MDTNSREMCIRGSYNTRLAQQQKTQELQDKISQLMEAGAAQKQQQETTIRGNTANWYNDLLSSYYGNAVQQGTDLYNNDQERAAALDVYKRQTIALISAAVSPLLDPIEDFGSYCPFSDILVLTPSVLCGTMVSEERFWNCLLYTSSGRF